jgi:hypothetical protein
VIAYNRSDIRVILFGLLYMNLDVGIVMFLLAVISSLVKATR